MMPKQQYYALTANKVIQALEKRNLEGFYCPTKEEAVQKLLELMKENSTVSFGGSMTLGEINALEVLKQKNYTLFDRSQAQTPEEVDEIYHKALSCDYYLMSSNAITLDGKLINIDGRGNRIAALIYGPKEVILVVGMNKLVPDEEQGIKRARSYAAPVNALRLSCKTPCTSTGACHDCTSPDCICCHVLVTRMSRTKDRIKVILVGEELGY